LMVEGIVSGIILQMFHVSILGQNQNILLLSQIYRYFCHIEIHFKFNLPEKTLCTCLFYMILPYFTGFAFLTITQCVTYNQKHC